MTDQFATFSLPSAETSAKYAAALGQRLRGGDTILLEGDVGAGKTHFARSLILSLLDVPEDVPSPTFTLVQTYPSTRGDIWHADLYRLTSSQEIEELGLVDAFETDICLVEWPDRLGALMPTNALTLRLDPGDTLDTRVLTAQWSDQRWADRLSGWPL
ncbi:MAG: tRNA (adenosine(37)-N6)-threonylcarbamoyltransferase complex ATPase subunit type 1 TsaE [Sulfitobacter sp.]